jgi:hypothetical protein
MARSYAKLMVGIAADPDFAELTAGAQRLYMLLLANPKLSSAGCIPYQPTKWVKWSSDGTLEAIARACGELAAAGFVLLDDDTEEMLIRSFIRHDGGYKNPKMLKGVRSTIDGIESPSLRAFATAQLESCLVDRPSIDDRRAFDGDRIDVRSKPDSNYSLQPATLPPSTLQPAATVSGSPLMFLSDTQRDVAAAAEELWITWRLKQPDVKHPDRLERTLRADAPGEWHGKVAEYLKEWPTATAEGVLFDVYRINPQSMNRRAV